MSSETSEWVVVNSKSRKKEVYEDGREQNLVSEKTGKPGPSRSNLNVSQQSFYTRSNKNAGSHQNYNSAGQSKPSFRPSQSTKKVQSSRYNAQNQSKSCGPSGLRQNTPTKYGTNDVAKIDASIVSKPSLAPRVNATQAKSLLAASSPSTTAAFQVPSSSVPDTSLKSPSKKKRQPSKEVRRKKREEKFYQALYQNKDSHIHFVSPDVIRQLQNPVTKSPVKREPPPTILETTEAPIRPFDDFPFLPPSASTSKKTTVWGTPVFQSVSAFGTESSPNPDATQVTPTPPEVTPQAPVPKGKKSSQPMVIDVSSLIVTKHKDKETRKPSKLHSIRENVKVTTGNLLDSSGPSVINRGKIRAKKKKPTKLKLTVLKCRALRRSLLQETEMGHHNSELKSEEAKHEESFNEEEPKTKIKEEIYVKKEETDSGEVDMKEKINVYAKLLDEMSKLTTKEEPQLDLVTAVKKTMHNRKFRDYCDMYTSKELFHYVMQYLTELFKFQDRLYHTDPIKFKIKRRFVQGLKEALSYLSLNKVQLMIIAADIERNPEPGGLDEKIAQIVRLAKDNNVPYIFCGSKYNLGKPIRIKTPVCVISVLNGQSCEEKYRIMMEEATQLREKYNDEFQYKLKELKAE